MSVKVRRKKRSHWDVDILIRPPTDQDRTQLLLGHTPLTHGHLGARKYGRR